ncbi:MAG: SRPBCC family protein [Cellvibrionaceae bacterium]|nr:SRPBCC family protein [Cellvibrionaceae bacterium]
MPNNIVKLHRVLVSTPEKIYRAFVEPEAWVRWLPPKGFTAKIHEQNPVVGGSWRMSFTNFSTGNSHSFGGIYKGLEPNQRVSYTAKFDAPELPGEMTTTVDIRAVSCGVDITIVQEGIPDVIPVESCYLGWQESLQFLAALVEPEIPDA